MEYIVGAFFALSAVWYLISLFELSEKVTGDRIDTIAFCTTAVLMVLVMFTGFWSLPGAFAMTAASVFIRAIAARLPDANYPPFTLDALVEYLRLPR